MSTQFIHHVIRLRWWLAIASLVILGFSLKGFQYFTLDASVRGYFEKDYIHFQHFSAFENIYGEEQLALAMISPKDGDIFNPTFLKALADLTQQSWQLPFIKRVDSLANYQLTTPDEDDLLVDDFIPFEYKLSSVEANDKKQIALNDESIKGKFVTTDGKHVAILFNFQLPDGDQQKSTEVANALYALTAQFEQEYQNTTGKVVNTYLSGNTISIFHNIEIAKTDMGLMIPLMFLIMFVMLGLIMKTISGTLIAFIIAIISSISAFAIGSYIGIVFAIMTFNAMIIVITITIAHCIHIINHFQSALSTQTKREALHASFEINLLPVCLTSLTTLLGFLSLNFSQLPPVVSLGNIAAIGVMVCWVLTFTLLPLLMLLFPFKVKAQEKTSWQWINKLADYVIKHKKQVLLISLAATGIMLYLSLQNILNDRFSELIEKPHVFRNANETIDQHFGAMYSMDLDIKSGAENNITHPDYLNYLDTFATWLRSQPEVKSVTVFSDLIKRLNYNMHNNNEAYYRIPEDQNLAAQYLLLYEMSLPFGLDLNNQLNMDKSSTRLNITFASMDTQEVFDVEQRIINWQQANLPELLQTKPTSVAIMWSYLGFDSLISALKSSFIALLLISIIMIFVLRSLRYGLISLAPNILPAIFGFGTWYLIKGEIDMGLMAVLIITIGIVVDDTVHFLSKYQYAREKLALETEEAIRYAFTTVGSAIVTTTFVLATGFSLLILSESINNTGLGLLTSIILVYAMILDFLLLPALLLFLDKKKVVKECDFQLAH